MKPEYFTSSTIFTSSNFVNNVLLCVLHELRTKTLYSIPMQSNPAISFLEQSEIEKQDGFTTKTE